jgi:ligand-binding sensor domain-containing protein
LDFEASRDQSFWISSTDTVYHWKKNSGMNKFSLREITGSKNNVSSIYGLKIDKNDSIWVNTSENVFKHHEGKWKVVKTDAFSIDNFKSVPFMDVDIFGNVWLAEKNYQAFTTLHCFNGVAWTSCKLYPPLESWITDIETADGTTILVGTTQGLQKLTLP